jgi:hypothetical protein
MSIHQQHNGLWVVTLPNGRVFTGMSKQETIDHAEDWLKRNY